MEKLVTDTCSRAVRMPVVLLFQSSLFELSDDMMNGILSSGFVTCIGALVVTYGLVNGFGQPRTRLEPAARRGWTCRATSRCSAWTTTR